ncbi:MAG TPA: FKBP-type peptidyl-prolyl cis-trans isomerase [Catalimonadaceae bacterium]|nr:FKBP-type peptidyl-prolyl cis-trans isomerase [Catalimonadaceae bacterium]
MFLKTLRPATAVAILAIFATACDKNPFGGGHSKTENGLEYELVENQEGTNAAIGDFISLHITYRTDKDSVLNSTHKMGQPISTKIGPSTFKGSFEEGLTLLSAGDSANFWISTDSIFKGQPDDQRPPFLKPGSKIQYSVRMVKVEKPENVEANQLAAIEDFGKKNNLTLQKTESGLRYAIQKEGSGEKATVGDTIVAHYVGKTMYEGKEFDNSIQRNQPFKFPVGMGMVIPGWDEGFQLFTKGTKATLVIPSKLGYGEMGAPGSPIGPNSPLVFDIELLDIKHKVEAASKEKPKKK